MKEHILFEKIENYREEVNKRPLEILPNILLMTYLALAKKYDDLLLQTERFLMENMQTNTLVEDFSLLGNIALSKLTAADIIQKNILMQDPEDPYAHLLKTIQSPTKENLQISYTMLGENDKRIIRDAISQDLEDYKYYRIPTIIGRNDNVLKELQQMVKKEPTNVILRTSLAEAYAKLDMVKEAEKELSFVLSLHPHYIRALHIRQRILTNHYGKEDESLNISKKIYKLNPISQYLKGMEVMFIEENEIFMHSELKDLFERENPFLKYFTEHFSLEGPKSNTEQTSVKDEQQLINAQVDKTKTLENKNNPKIQEEEYQVHSESETTLEESKDLIDLGYKNLYKENYKKAIEAFLEELKNEKY